MASTARVVCWQYREEWLYVYRSLYSFDDPEAQRKGLDRVAAWKSRSAGKLPLAIECTANLISAQLAIENIGCDVQSRLTLAMAIVRFVNGMVDQVQKGKFARSVQSIADEIGLPDWLVDLRHEATHASLPSMDTLQCGLRVSLSWLQGEYWEPQINVHDGNTEKLSQLLNEYRLIAMSYVTSKKKNEKLKYSGRMKELSEEIVNVVSRSSLWCLLPSILCHEDMLFPSHEQLNALHTKWLPQESSSASSIDDVPTEIIKIWKTLLEALDKSSSEFTTSLIIHFLENLSDVHNDQTGDLSPSYAAWVKCLLEALSSKKPSLVLTKDIPWVTVLQVTLENPTSYSLTLIPLILNNTPAISAAMKGKIQNLVLAFLNLECSSTDCMEDSPYFDLEEFMVNRRHTSLLHQQQDEHSSANLGWEISQGNTQWHLIPFGEVLGTSNVSPTNLELSESPENSYHRNNVAECLSQPKNDTCVSYNESDLSDSDNNDDMSVGQNSSDQLYHNMQDKEPVEITEATHEYIEDTEGENEIASISNQIYLF